MIIGVIAFSVANGTLASIMSSDDTEKAELTDRLNMLDRIRTDFYLPHDIYITIKKDLIHKSKDKQDLDWFVATLPPAQ